MVIIFVVPVLVSGIAPRVCFTLPPLILFSNTDIFRKNVVRGYEIVFMVVLELKYNRPRHSTAACEVVLRINNL